MHRGMLKSAVPHSGEQEGTDECKEQWVTWSAEVMHLEIKMGLRTVQRSQIIWY